MATLSIVIPCYNGWKYMNNCLKKLEEQTRLADEVIIIDDCSTDKTYYELIKYSKQSNLNISVLHNEHNLGPGKSREVAINKATKEYIAFCDCDDWYEDTFVEKVLAQIERNNPDVLIFDSYTISSDGRKKIDHIATKIKDSNKEEIIANYAMSLCRLVVKKELFNSVQHCNLKHGEDGVVVLQLLLKASTIEVIDIPLYNYLFRLDSASKKPDKNTCTDMFSAFNLIQSYSKSLYPVETEFLGVKYVCYGGMLAGLKANIEKNVLLNILSLFEKEYPGWFKNQYISSLGKEKILFLGLIRNRFFIGAKVLAKMHPLVVRLISKK